MSHCKHPIRSILSATQPVRIAPLPLPWWERLRSGGRRPKIIENEFIERRPKRDAARRRFMVLVRERQVMDFSGEGVFGGFRPPLWRKLRTWLRQDQVFAFSPTRGRGCSQSTIQKKSPNLFPTSQTRATLLALPLPDGSRTCSTRREEGRPGLAVTCGRERAEAVTRVAPLSVPGQKPGSA